HAADDPRKTLDRAADVEGRCVGVLEIWQPVVLIVARVEGGADTVLAEHARDQLGRPRIEDAVLVPAVVVDKRIDALAEAGRAHELACLGRVEAVILGIRAKVWSRRVLPVPFPA